MTPGTDAAWEMTPDQEKTDRGNFAEAFRRKVIMNSPAATVKMRADIKKLGDPPSTNIEDRRP